MRSILSRDVLKYLRKKRRKEILIQTETVTLPDIPEEVLIEILIRLPAKSLMRFKCVSKLWLSLISSHYFSNRRPLRFFAYLADQDNPGNYAWFTSSSVSVMSQDVTVPRTKGYFLSAARGLVCIRSGTTVQICNIHTRQLVQLPALRSRLIRDNNVRCYLGYNPVHDEYKVLSVAWKVESYTLTRSKHQVLVLGAGASWRKIQCNVPHRAFLMGITINGVLYYGASTRTLRCVLVSFDLTSEEFTLTEFPNTGTWHWYLSCTNIVMNYQGKVALLDYSKGVTVNLWVLEDADKSQWSDKKTFALPLSQMNFIIPETQKLKMGSTSRSGQVWLTMEGRRKKYQPTRFCFLIYDLERNEIMQRIEMGPLPSSSKWSLSTFWDDTENLMYLET